MVEKNTTIKERILQYAKNKGVSIENFLASIDMTYGSFKGKAKEGSLNSTAIAKIYTIYPDINLTWLLTGEGDMTGKPNLVSEPQMEYRKRGRQSIPLLPIEAVAGFGSGNWSVSEYDVQEHYVIPDFKSADFLIPIKGDSMLPKYSSGDIVACRKLNDGFIQWNKSHVISTNDQGIMVKRIRKSDKDDHFLLVSDNKEYPPFDVPKKEINGIAIVIGSIHFE